MARRAIAAARTVGPAVAVTLLVVGTAAVVVATRRAAAGAAAPGSSSADPRVVSLLPAASAFLVAIGAADHVVARATDDRTPGLDDRPEVGHLLSPNVEAVLGMRADVVVAWAGADLRSLRRAVAGSAVVVPLSFDRLLDAPRSLRLLSRAVGRPVEGARLADSLEARLRAVEARARGRPRIDALWVVASAPAVVAGPGTLADDLMRVAGARNVLADARASWPRPSMEELVRRDPDVLIWPVGQGLPPFDDLPAGSLWRVLPAVRDGRVIEIEADLVHEAGPRVAEAALRLSELLRLHVSPTPNAPHAEGTRP